MFIVELWMILFDPLLAKCSIIYIHRKDHSFTFTVAILPRLLPYMEVTGLCWARMMAPMYP